MSIRVAINGFGRIGRAFFKLGFEEEDIEIVAINDLGDVHNMAYLLQYDSAQGYTDYDIEVAEDQHTMTVDGKEIRIFAEKNPVDLPWGDHDIDVVVESTGFFTKYEDAGLHLQAGAKRVVISAPAKGEATGDIVGATVLMGVNEEKLATCNVTSNASCTTNAGSPIMKILSEKIGIEKALLNTIHSYTASQPLVDSPSHKDFRLGRAGATLGERLWWLGIGGYRLVLCTHAAL